MLRQLSRSTTSPQSPRRQLRNSIRSSATTTQLSPQTTRSWTPGDPIKFEEDQDKNEKGKEWTPGCEIKFGGASVLNEPLQERPRTKAGKEANSKACARARSKHLSPAPAARHNLSPSTSRATHNSSPHSYFDLSCSTANSSWPSSHRWDPPSPSNSSLSDLSLGSTARFSHTRSYANISNTSRLTGQSTIGGDDEMDRNSQVESGSFVGETRSTARKIDFGVQVGSPQIKPTGIATDQPRRSLAPSVSQAELDELTSGVDFDDESGSFEFDRDNDISPNKSTLVPSMSTPQKILSQPQVEELVSGIDFSQDVEMSDEGEGEEETFHSAIASPRPASPAPTPSRLQPLGTPRMIVKNPSSKPPSSPSFPFEPDVFTLPSTTPPTPCRAIPKSSTRPSKSKPLSSSTLSLLSSSPQSINHSPQIRLQSSTSTASIGDDSLPSPNRLKGWDSVVKSIEETKKVSSAKDDFDDSIEIIESQSTRVASATGNKKKEETVEKGKGRAVPKESSTVSKGKENQQPPTKPGYFARPPGLKPSTSSTSTSTSFASSKPIASSSSSTSARITTTTTTTKTSQYRRTEPKRESFKGRNAEDRYKNALKQFKFQEKWPKTFDYKKWGTREPKVVYTVEEKKVEEVLKEMKGPLGFDLEWDPWNHLTKAPGKTALVQVCDEERILLVHVAKMKTFPKSLRDLIEDDKRIKLGVQIAGDARKLEKDFSLKPRGLLEMNDLVRRYDGQQFATRNHTLISLQELVGIYLDRYLPKENDVRCGKWSAALSDVQKSYGANDVYSSLHVVLALQSLANSTSESTIDLLDLTTPRQRTGEAEPLTIPRKLPIRPNIEFKGDPSSPLASLAPRKLEAYTLFQIDELPLSEVATRMSETTSIKQSSVLWSLLSIYQSFKTQGLQVEWNEERIVKAVDEIGTSFQGRLKDEHGKLVQELRQRVASVP